MRIEYSPKADKDLINIYHYLADNFGELVAKEKIDKVIDYIDLLADNAYFGKSIDGKDKNLRLISIPPCVVVYNIDAPIIEIVHIVDARTDYIRNLL
jgi:plasmid stabilization system protein ParE